MQEATPSSTVRQDAEKASLFAILLLVDSMFFIWARLLLPRISPLASSFFVLAVATIEVGVFALVRRQLHWRPALSHFWFFASIGFLIATSTALGYLSVAYIDPGTASMLGKAGVIFSLLLSVVWLHERLARPQVFGAALAVVGVLVISFHPGSTTEIGAIITLASALLYALHTAIVKRYGEAMPFLDFFFHRLLFTTVFLLIFALVGRQLVWPDAMTWGILIVVGTVDVVISRALYYKTLRMFSMAVHTIILTLSPVVSIVVALFLFGTFPSVQELIGGAAVLAGVVFVTRGR
ncbi:MAG: DMT family transporter [Anaerolineales bacterium]|nr:DMT family transporter [Anaerolineales bacterium]